MTCLLSLDALSPVHAALSSRAQPGTFGPQERSLATLGMPAGRGYQPSSFLRLLANLGDRRTANIPIRGGDIFKDDPDVVPWQLQHVADPVDNPLGDLVLLFL